MSEENLNHEDLEIDTQVEVEEETSGKKTKRRRRNPKTVTGIVSLS